MAKSNSSSSSSDDGGLTTLYHPDGREYQVGNQAEKTRLLAAGYTTQAPPKEEAEALAEKRDAMVTPTPPPVL